jgi:hypothetical protein
MQDANSSGSEDGGNSDSVVLVALSLAALVLAMVASFYYRLPSGEPFGIVDFVVLWLRAILISA